MNKEEKKRLEKLMKRARKKKGLYDDRPHLGAKKMYMLTEANFEFHLIELILMLNDINVTDVIIASDYGTIIDDFGFNKKFKKASALNWSKKYDADVFSYEFRAKFLTLMLFWILDHCEDIVDVVYSHFENKKEGKIKRKVLKTISTRIDSFVVNFLCQSGDYSDTMLDMLDLMMLKSDSNNVAKVMKHYKTQVEFLNHAFDDPDYELPLIWHNIIRLAYMMTTNNANFKNLPDYDKDLDLYDAEHMKESIGRLGIAILIQQKKKKPDFYKMFEKATPRLVATELDTDDCIELRVGVKSLIYLAFILSNQSVTTLIWDVL